MALKWLWLDKLLQNLKYLSNKKKSITFDRNQELFKMAYTITDFIAIMIKV